MSFCLHSPFDQLYHDEVVSVAAVKQDEAVGGGGFELKEKVHGVVGLQSGEGHIAGARLEGHGVGDDVLEANHGVELTVINVTVFTEVYVGHAVKGEALEVANEVGRHHGHEALLCHNARLNVVELQLGVVACHLTFDQQRKEGREGGCYWGYLTLKLLCNAFLQTSTIQNIVYG